MDKIRLDKWLWAARFYKTRSLAARAISTSHVKVNGQAVKPAREVSADDLVAVHKPGGIPVEVVIVGISNVRGPAPIAQQLYRETESSATAREKAIEMRRLAPEPAHSISTGRPTKRDRRQMERARHQFLAE